MGGLQVPQYGRPGGRRALRDSLSVTRSALSEDRHRSGIPRVAHREATPGPRAPCPRIDGPVPVPRAPPRSRADPSPSSPIPLGAPARLQDLEFRQFVERLKLRSPIEEVVRERVPELTKRGRLWQARCPFHDERTPSFTVDPQRGTWHCWGACGEGGDVISFLERFEGVEFLDALRLLASRSGEAWPETLVRGRRGASNGEAEARYDVLSRAERLYRRMLATPEGEAARAYAAARGLAPETLAAFGIGWAPRTGSPLLEAAGEAGVPRELLYETGLVRRADDGRAYDFFRGRWMIPIRDRLGRTVGFGGRVLPEDEVRADGRPQAKYVNTAETPLFQKGRLIFGLDLARDEIRRTRNLVLVEGYTDVMALHQVGVRCAAAVLGTATTPDHAALVRRSGARRVTLLFDGDAAGREATRRALAGLLPLELDLRVAVLPAGTDPCDLALGEGGREALGALLEGAEGWFEWALAGLAGLAGPDLAHGVDRLFELLARLEKPVEVSSRLRELAGVIRIPEEDVRGQWRQFRESPVGRPQERSAVETGHPGPGGPSASEGPESVEPIDPALESCFELLLGALLLDNSLIPVYGDLEPECPPGDLRTIFRLILELESDEDDPEPIHAGRILTLLGDDPARHRVGRLEARARTAESPSLLARDQERWLLTRRHEAELERLRRSLHEADSREEVLRDLHARLKNTRLPSQPLSPPH